MSGNIESLEEIMRHRGTQLWAGGVRMLSGDTPEVTQYLVECDGLGQWSLAVRGYNQGIPLPVDAVKDDGLWYGQGDDLHRVVDRFQTLDEVPIEASRAFRDAVRGDEVIDDLLVQVLEKKESGIWEVLTPQELNEYDTSGQLIIDTPERAAFRPVHFTADANEGMAPASFAGFSYELQSALAVELEYADPMATVRVIEFDEPLWVLSSLRDRVHTHPTCVRYIGSLNDETALAAEARDQLDRTVSPQQD